MRFGGRGSKEGGRKNMKRKKALKDSATLVTEQRDILVTNGDLLVILVCFFSSRVVYLFTVK